MDYKLTFVAWREGMREGRLLGLKCNDCAAVTCPPRKVCTECGSENQEVIELNGTGQIKSFTVCHAVPTGFQGPYTVAVVDLDGGGRVMGNVVGIDPGEVGTELIGKKVTLGYKEIAADFMTGQDTRLAMTFKLID